MRLALDLFSLLAMLGALAMLPAAYFWWSSPRRGDPPTAAELRRQVESIEDHGERQVAEAILRSIDADSPARARRKVRSRLQHLHDEVKARRGNYLPVTPPDSARPSDAPRRTPPSHGASREIVGEISGLEETLSAILAEYPNLREKARVEDLMRRACEDATYAVLNEARGAVKAIQFRLAERNDLLRGIGESSANQLNLARRVSKGELDGRAFEVSNTMLEKERADLELRLRALDEELFSEVFEKPV